MHTADVISCPDYDLSNIDIIYDYSMGLLREGWHEGEITGIQSLSHVMSSCCTQQERLTAGCKNILKYTPACMHAHTHAHTHTCTHTHRHTHTHTLTHTHG